MVKSINCLILGNTSFDDTFAVNVADDNKIGDVQIDIKSLKILDLKFLVYKEINHNNEFNHKDIKLWKVNIAENEGDKLKEFKEDNIIGGKLLIPIYNFNDYFEKLDPRNIHVIVQVPTSTASPSQQGVPQVEELLTIERIIEIGQKIKNKDKPVITMYNYVERTHIQQFIRDRIETNLEAFEHGSSYQNDYQGISISGGSGTGKTRHGFEMINIIKDLKQIKDGIFDVIHIFVQIFPESYLVHFDKRPSRSKINGRYPHDLSHVNLVGHYLALAIASYYFTKNYRPESLQYFKELAKSSAFDLLTVLRAIRQSYNTSKKLLILLQLDEYQRDEYLIANILRFTSQLVADKQVCELKVLIIPICTGTAPIKLQNFDDPGHLSVTDYNVYDIHMSPMDIEKSLSFMDSVIDHKMKTSNEPTIPISRNNPLYRILIGAIRGIAVIMEQCASEFLKMKRPLASAEQAKEIWQILVDWAKRKYLLINWLNSVGGRKDPQDKEDEKRKRAILTLMFWIHTQKLITKDTSLNDSTVGDHEAGGLIFLEESGNMQYKAKAPLVLIASLVSHLGLNFFDDIILNPFSQLDEESFPKFILHMHLITYRLADLIGIRQMTIKEIYFGCLLASNEILSKTIDIQPNVNYRSAPILKKKKNNDPINPFTWNKLIDRKKVSVITDASIGKVEDVDITTGCFIVLVYRRNESSDSLTPHADEHYKFSSAIKSDFPIHRTPTEEFTLNDFEKELKKTTEGCECFIVMTVKRFLHGVNELPSRVSGDLTTRTGIVFKDWFLKFMGIYGDFTRFIAEEVSEMTIDKGKIAEEVSEMTMDEGEEEVRKNQK